MKHSTLTLCRSRWAIVCPPCPAGVLLARRDGTGPHTDRYFSEILLADLNQVFFGTWGKLIDGQPLDKLVLPLTIGYEDPNGIIHKYNRTLEQYLRVFEPGVPHNVTEQVKRTRTVTRTVHGPRHPHR